MPDRLPASRRHPWIGAPPTQGQAPRPLPFRLFHRREPPRRGWHAVIQSRSPEPEPPTGQLPLWLTYEDRPSLDLIYLDTLNLTLTDQSHAG